MPHVFRGHAVWEIFIWLFFCFHSILIRTEVFSCIFCNSQEQIYGSVHGIYSVIFSKSRAVLICALLSHLTAGFIIEGGGWLRQRRERCLYICLMLWLSKFFIRHLEPHWQDGKNKWLFFNLPTSLCLIDAVSPGQQQWGSLIVDVEKDSHCISFKMLLLSHLFLPFYHTSANERQWASCLCVTAQQSNNSTNDFVIFLLLCSERKRGDHSPCHSCGIRVIMTNANHGWILLICQDDRTAESNTFLHTSLLLILHSGDKTFSSNFPAVSL